MSDTEFRHEDLPIVPNTFNPIMATSGILPGMVVAASATPNTAVAARSNDAATAYVTGMYLGPAPSTAGSRSQVRYSGVVALEAADWPLVTEEGTVLTSGVPYYASDTTPGKITKTPPSAEGDVPEQIGVSLSTTAILVQIGVEGGAVGPPGPPGSVTTEHKNFAGGTAASPTVNVTFQEDAVVAPATVTLADGTTDGFQKTFQVTALNDAAITITPANFNDGTSLHVAAGTAAACILTWNDSDGLWQVTSLYNMTVV